MRVYCFKTWQIKNWYLRVYVSCGREHRQKSILQKNKILPEKDLHLPHAAPRLVRPGQEGGHAARRRRPFGRRIRERFRRGRAVLRLFLCSVVRLGLIRVRPSPRPH